MRASSESKSVEAFHFPGKARQSKQSDRCTIQALTQPIKPYVRDPLLDRRPSPGNFYKLQMTPFLTGPSALAPIIKRHEFPRPGGMPLCGEKDGVCQEELGGSGGQ